MSKPAVPSKKPKPLWMPRWRILVAVLWAKNQTTKAMTLTASTW